MSLEIEDKLKFNENIVSSVDASSKKYKILLICQDSTDILLVNKLLGDLGAFKVYEAGNLKTALKVTSYLSLDLIIVDDKLPTLSGYDIIKRLDKSITLKNVPKVMLLTKDYKVNSYKEASFKNLDFIKKPIDSMIFKTRIDSILRNKEDKYLSGSIFENMIDAKISEAKEFLKIYKSFLDIDQNLLFVYDKNRNLVVESNRHFANFFGENSLFNRVIKNPRLIQKFLPKMSDPSYLNSHDSKTWVDLIDSASDFNFLITLKNRSKTYTFNIVINKIKLFAKEMYIVKLSNHNRVVLEKKESIKYSEAVFTNLRELKSQIDVLNESKQKDKMSEYLSNLLSELNISIPLLKKSEHKEDVVVNIYFIVAKILKDRLGFINATLNSEKITKEFEENYQEINIKISPDALNDAIRGILDNYHEVENLKVDIQLYQLKKNLKIEIITTSKSQNDNSSIIDKFFKNQQAQNHMNDQMVPKHVQNALSHMSADIKTYFNNGQNIFLITLPLD